MPPRQQQHQKAQPPFEKFEKVLCFHLDLLYEARITDVVEMEEGDGWLYKIHYKGWKASWDDWVTQDRVRKFTQENQELAQTLLAQKRQATEKGPKSAQLKKSRLKGVAGSDVGSGRGSEERGAGVGGSGAGGGAGGPGGGLGGAGGAGGSSGGGVTSSGRGPRRYRDYELEQEEQFYARPSVKIPVPDYIKALLVDDWENVTKNQQLVPLPHPHPVKQILADYVAYEGPNRPQGGAKESILEETMMGFQTYFDMAIGRILLYRFERPQYREMHNMWTEGTDEDHKSACDTYGPEHLCRLIVNLPELIAQTNMDHQSVTRLKEEIIKFTQWLARNASKYFAPEYESPSADYIEKARAA